MSKKDSDHEMAARAVEPPIGGFRPAAIEPPVGGRPVYIEPPVGGLPPIVIRPRIFEVFARSTWVSGRAADGLGERSSLIVEDGAWSHSLSGDHDMTHQTFMLLHAATQSASEPGVFTAKNGRRYHLVSQTLADGATLAVATPVVE